MTEHRLLRSGEHPLTVRWNVFHLNEQQMSLLAKLLERIVLPGRWKALEVGRTSTFSKHRPNHASIQLEATSSTLPDPIVSIAKALEYMKIGINGVVTIPLQQFPRLSHLSLAKHCHLSEDLPHTITHLELHDLRAANRSFLEYLTHLSLEAEHLFNLRRFQLVNLQHLECKVLLSNATTEFTALQTLIIGASHQNSIILRAIIAPKLERLEIIGPSGPHCEEHICGVEARTVPLNTFGHQLRPHSFTLESCLWPSHIVQILRDMPSVQHLTVSFNIRGVPALWNVLADALLESSELSNQSKAYTICPHLVSLVLRLNWIQTNMEAWEEFAGRILAGRAKFRALKYVRCEWQDGNVTTMRSQEER